MSYIVRLFVAALASACGAWGCLAALSAVRVWRTLETLNGDAVFGDEAPRLMTLFDETARTMQGGDAVFIAAAVSGVVLSEIFGTRSLLYYMAAAGAVAVLLAAGLTPSGPQSLRSGSTVIAIAGFFGGATYWFFRGRPA